MGKKSIPEDELIPEVEPTEEELDFVRRRLDEIDKRKAELEKSPYDGVLGVPPDWVPLPIIDRFRQTRDRVLSDWGYTPEVAREWIDRYCRIGEENDDWFYPGNYPNGRYLDSDYFVKTIGVLANLRWAISLGPEEGLRELVGDHAVRGYKIVSSGSEGGKTKGMNASQEKEEILKIAKQITDRRSRRPSDRELARLVVREKYPNLKRGEAEKKADVIRHWFD
jgi:hypothetical protein